MVQIPKEPLQDRYFYLTEKENYTAKVVGGGWSDNACVRAKLLQSCSALCDPMDCSPPGSSVHGVLQAGTLEWVAVPPPGDLPEPGMNPHPFHLLHCPVGSLPLAPPGRPLIPLVY